MEMKHVISQVSLICQGQHLSYWIKYPLKLISYDLHVMSGSECKSNLCDQDR